MQVRQGHPFLQVRQGHPFFGADAAPCMVQQEVSGLDLVSSLHSPSPGWVICTSVGREWGLPKGRSQHSPGLEVGDTGDISCGTCVVLKAASLEDIPHVDFYESLPFVGPELEQPT